MLVARMLAMPALLMVSLAVAAESCDRVVEDTIAEMRAGAGDSWSGDVERAVRAAAGSACVKAQSGRYEGRTPAVAGDERLTDEPLMDEALQKGATEEATSTAAAATSTAGVALPQASDAGAEAGAEKEEGFSIGGLSIRGASGPPSKKSYERARTSKVEE